MALREIALLVPEVELIGSSEVFEEFERFIEPYASFMRGATPEGTSYTIVRSNLLKAMKTDIRFREKYS